MNKKNINDMLYRKLMQDRRKDPKSYGLSMIGVAYEDLCNYAKSIKVKLEDFVHKSEYNFELDCLFENLRFRMGEIICIYSLTHNDIREYFVRNKYSVLVLEHLQY